MYTLENLCLEIRRLDFLSHEHAWKKMSFGPFLKLEPV